MHLQFYPPSIWRIFVVERLVDDAHDGLACAAEVNPDQNQSTVQTWGKQVTLLQHLLSALYVLTGGILIKKITETVSSQWDQMLRNIHGAEPFTYGVDPDAELRGAEGQRQTLGAGVRGRRVLVDGSSKQRRRRAVAVQHRGQQRRGLLLRTAHRDNQALSCRHRVGDTSFL